MHFDLHEPALREEGQSASIGREDELANVIRAGQHRRYGIADGPNRDPIPVWRAMAIGDLQAIRRKDRVTDVGAHCLGSESRFETHQRAVRGAEKIGNAEPRNQFSDQLRTARQGAHLLMTGKRT